MTSILVSTNDLRAGLVSTVVHASTDTDLPSICRVRLDIGRENITITTTDRFTAACAIVSVFALLDTDREETDLAWIDVIDLAVDDVQKILSIFKAPKDKGDEPQYLLRIDADDKHVTVTDSSGMIDGRALKLPRLPADESYPNLEAIFARHHHADPVLIENLAVGGSFLARFKAAASCYREPLIVESSKAGRGLLIRCGESFLGLLMPVTVDEDADHQLHEWRHAWTRRFDHDNTQDDAA